MKSRRSSTLVLCIFCCAFAGGCSSEQRGSQLSSAAGSGASASSLPTGGGNANGGAPNGSGVGAAAGLELLIDVGGSSGSGTAAGDGTPEACDGVDNDSNGIIDDVDKNSDGVCDCLLIATLGVKGTSGQGDVFAAWLTTRSNNGATDLGDQILTPELLAKYQVIVAQNVSRNHAYSAEEAAALSAWVNQGGGFMTLIGYSPTPGEALNVNRLLAPFAMQYTDRQILPKIGRNTIPITMWNPHPIDTGVLQVGVDNGYPVEGMGTVIATGGGYDVGKVQVLGQGHVFVWGDEWVTYNSEWTGHPDYQVQLFWLNSIKWLTVAGECQIVIPPDPPK